ncbi:MAG TPA: DUF167 domain-containing protein [Nitrospira sp.]|nr:DUF167 domain-containing protein [Nitrospira sp.]
MMTPPIVCDSQDGALLTVHVQPNCPRTQCVGRYGDALKIRVAAPPVDGAANDELIRFLAREFSVPASGIHIEFGTSGRRKCVLLKGVGARHIEAYLAKNGW